MTQQQIALNDLRWLRDNWNNLTTEQKLNASQVRLEAAIAALDGKVESNFPHYCDTCKGFGRIEDPSHITSGGLPCPVCGVGEVSADKKVFTRSSVLKELDSVAHKIADAMPEEMTSMYQQLTDKAFEDDRRIVEKGCAAPTTNVVSVSDEAANEFYKHYDDLPEAVKNRTSFYVLHNVFQKMVVPAIDKAREMDRARTK